MTEPLRAEGTPVGLGEEMVEVLVEVFYKDQGLSPKVDFCFFKQVVFFHLNQMKSQKSTLQGMLASPSPDQSPTRCRRGVSPPTQERGPTLACQHQLHTPLAALKVTFYFHSYFSTGEEFFFSRLNMTFDKDVFVVPSQDILGAWC